MTGKVSQQDAKWFSEDYGKEFELTEQDSTDYQGKRWWARFTKNKVSVLLVFPPAMSSEYFEEVFGQHTHDTQSS